VRNLLLFVLFLIGLFYARRALRGKGGNAGKAADKGPDAAGGGRQREAEHLEIEQMVACAHCGLHVPESESIRGAGEFFCSDEHRRLGVRR
jgi:uncharacterized protein